MPQHAHSQYYNLPYISIVNKFSLQRCFKANTSKEYFLKYFQPDLPPYWGIPKRLIKGRYWLGCPKSPWRQNQNA